MKGKEHVVIIGAGVTGLAAAYHLLRRDFRVTMVEASETVGGLAGSIAVDGKPVDKYYHFICREDHDLISLIGELGLSDKLRWRVGKTSFFVDRRIYAFNTPFDLVAFTPVPFSERIRFGLHVLVSQHRKSWQGLDGISAKEWLIEQAGPKAYEIIWDPLLRIKFGAFHDQISAAWIWHRIHRVARSREDTFGANSYGFLEQGCAELVDALLSRLTVHKSFRIAVPSKVGAIEVEDSRVTGVRLGSGDEFISAEAVVSTVAIPHFLQLAPDMGEYTRDLASIEYLNIVCALFQLDRPFTDSFWLNVNDPDTAFNGIVELTNLNPRPDIKDSHFVYIPFYLHFTDPRWKMADDELYHECTAGLRIIRPDFDHSWIKNWWVSRDLNAQAICRVGFTDVLPSHATPVSGLYITDSSQYYPEDRTVSASVRLGRMVAHVLRKRYG